VANGPKTDAGKRYIALDLPTLAALRAWKRKQAEERLHLGSRYVDSGLVFTMRDGSPITPNRLSIWFRSAVRRSGVEPIRLHDLRHTHATILLRRGIPVKVVSVRLGHRNIGITLDTYAHVLPQDDEAAAGASGELFG
jgi:integrase